MFGLSYLDISVIALYVLIITYLAWRIKTQVSSSGDYFMGGRKGSKFMMIANALGAGTHTDQAIAVSGATYQIGLAGIWYQWVWLFATPFYWLIAPIYRRLRYITTGDFFEERYGSKLGAAYTIMGMLYFIINIGLILKGTATAIEAVTKGAISLEVIVLLLTIFFLLYGVFGGLSSALTINIIQGMFILVLSFLLIPFAISTAGGISEIKNNLPEHMFSFVAPEEVTLFFIIMIIINGLIGIVVQPHHMAVGGSGKSEYNCRMGWTYGNFTKRFATLGWAFVGVFAAALFPGLENENRELAFGTAVVNLLPSGLIGLMIAAMAAAVLAACHNFMVGGSALFTRNLYKKFIDKNLSENDELKVARIASTIIVIGGVTIALTIPSVVQGLKYMWMITAYFGIAFWMAIIWKKSNRYGVWASLVTTLLATFATGPYFSFGLGWSLEYQIAVYLPIGFITFIIFSLLTNEEPKEQLEKFYTLLHTPVGEEYKLKEKGIEILLEGQSEVNTEINKDDISLEEKGHGLILVDLMSLGEKFRFNKYSIDIKGFGIAILFVLAIFAFGMLTANIG
ncbi:MAG: sodium:solute symporter family protein [Ignavibacteriales bacterium]|nr:sodium:solute symporter family protein [Ignavibacteriales bacterium]MCB9259988.1 sodium:solute symporter family protein [Ignavibacteriales bacterium]